MRPMVAAKLRACVSTGEKREEKDLAGTDTYQIQIGEHSIAGAGRVGTAVACDIGRRTGADAPVRETDGI